jgi:3-hydroxyacyl-CoA dehydrogenase
MKALVVYSDAANFSAGANLGLMMGAAKVGKWDDIEALIKAGQDTYMALKYAPFPTVAGVAGMALGGGCELALHCSAIQAHGETYAGLVEVGVGLIPGWGGCKEVLARWQALGKIPKGPMPAISKVFELISTATVSKSAADARDMLILRPGDGITMNRYRLLADAKARALSLTQGYCAPQPPVFALPGPSAQAALKMAVDGFVAIGKATKHDVVVSQSVANVLSGGDTDLVELLSEQQILDLERAQFMRLARHPDSQARIVHMLENGRPLRN